VAALPRSSRRNLILRDREAVNSKDDPEGAGNTNLAMAFTGAPFDTAATPPAQDEVSSETLAVL
jgi:hypothetical protein